MGGSNILIKSDVVIKLSADKYSQMGGTNIKLVIV